MSRLADIRKCYLGHVRKDGVYEIGTTVLGANTVSVLFSDLRWLIRQMEYHEAKTPAPIAVINPESGCVHSVHHRDGNKLTDGTTLAFVTTRCGRQAPLDFGFIATEKPVTCGLCLRSIRADGDEK